MAIRSSLFGLIIVAVVLINPIGVTAGSKPELNDAEDLLYLANDRLIILRLHVRIDGKSFETVWHEFIDHLLKELDKDKDGVLSSQEATQLPKRNELQQAGIISQSSSRTSGQADRNRDGKVTRDEIAKYIRGLGLTPFSTQISTQQTGRRGVTIRGRPGDAQGAELFGLLDTDKNGKLSRDEFVSAHQTLHKSDLDDDETISISELQPIQNPFLARRIMNANNTNQQPSFTTLSAVGSPSKLANQLLTRYDRALTSAGADASVKAEKDQNLSREELGLEEDSFRQFDADENGLLDYTELMRFVKKPVPAVEVIVRLGKRKPNEKLAEVLRSSSQLKASIRTSSSGLVTVMLGKTQIEIGVQQYGMSFDQSQVYKTQFKAADTDNNAYLEMKEVERNGFFRNTFRLMDRDGDGKVFEEEMLTFVRQIAAAAQARTVLNVGNAGRNLFEILDLNRDRRLGRRELMQAVERIELWDTDNDKQVAESELPTHFRLTISRGQAGFPGGPVSFVAAGGMRSPRGASGVGPLWFQKMDRNRDGDVSRREFIGGRAKFEKYDTNQDGLLDAVEALSKNP